MDYLRKLLSDYNSEGKVVNFMFSMGYFYEITQDDPNIFIWTTDNQTIQITSDKEYDLYLKENVKRRFKDGIKREVPDVIYVVDDKETSFKVYETISSNKNYNDRINDLMKVLKDQPLKLNL